jgi:alkanesulfonate monooxygenase SsuD/methylene tetrahydromethanopterin reductase-like flavin-dependent oxidoreductase (luciferase family)
VKVDLRTPPSQPVAKIVAFAQECEEAGFSGCGFNDAQMYFRDTYVVMSHVLANTKRLRVHPALTCPGPRHTSLVASSAKTVQEFGPDRFELWLGRGNAALRMVGIPQLTIKEMRDSITKIKRFMAGEVGVYTPTQTHSKQVRLHHGGGTAVPVYVSAAGPIMMRMAGELGDGVLLSCPLTVEGLASARKLVAEGAARVGKDPSAVHEVVQMRCLIRETRKEAVRAWSPILLRQLARDDAEAWLQERGIDYNLRPLKAELNEAAERLEQLYPDASHYEDPDAAERIASVIPEDLQEAAGDTMAVLGDPEQVAKRMLQLEGLGIEHVYLYPIQTFQLPEPELKAFREVIGPALKKSAAASGAAR